MLHLLNYLPKQLAEYIKEKNTKQFMFLIFSIYIYIASIRFL